MKLSKIKVKNFKSFEDINVDLNNFNVLIGACASGKSNFVEVFKFLRDISEDFERGLSKHGGEYYLKNSNLNSQEHPCYFNVTFVKSGHHDILSPVFEPDMNLSSDELVVMEINEFDYELIFDLNNENSYQILKELVKFSANFYKIEEKNKEEKESIIINKDHKILETSFIIKNSGGEITTEFNDNAKGIGIENLIPKYLIDMPGNNFYDVEKKHRLIINSLLSSFPISWASLFREIKFYDFHPKLCKQMGIIGGQPTLTEQGDNLPVILEEILKNDEKRRKFLNLLKNVLPYINDVDVEKVIEEHRIFTLMESYSNNPFPAPLVSDGTSDILALIVALYFERGNLILIEEPERNIHPALLSEIVQMMKEVSTEKQIIITTHSPEVLRTADLEDIFLISRNLNGFSNISKPINNEIVMSFIEELGIHEVYIDDLWELNNE